MKMKAYIGLNRDMTCGGFKYKEGETYHINKTKLRGSGFHAYEYPLDMLAYYPLNSSVYHEVKIENVSSEYKNDTKSIKIGARMDIANLVKASVEYIMSKCDSSRRRLAMGDRDATFAIGDSAEASAIGHYSTASATGDYGAALSTGFQGTASTTGWFIGWDYAHCTDYVGSISFNNFGTAKKWTTLEIINECKMVIDQLAKIITIFSFIRWQMG